MGGYLSQLATVEDADNLPDKPEYHFETEGNKAKVAQAKYLSTKTGSGTDPEADILGWSYVAGQLNATDPKLWVRLHLINEKKFSGRGGAPNLVPGTKNNNSHHLAAFENKLDKWLKEKNGDSYRVGGMRAEVKYLCSYEGAKA